MKHHDSIYVAGHTGLVGSALTQALYANGYINIITQTEDVLDLRNQQNVLDFFALHKPKYVFLAAARVGGILANNTYPAPFLYDNLMIASNVIHAAHIHKTTKLLFLGSSCMYPRECPQPMNEEYLLTGPLEQTNEAYALAKIAGLKLCQTYYKQYENQFISCIPTNLYGPRDNFNLEQSHVIPALIAKIYQAHQLQAPTVTIWGSGSPRREFLFADDLAQALIFLMKHYTKESPINIGTGQDISIFELALLIQNLIGYQGQLTFDSTKPDGTPQKLLNVSKLSSLGWKTTTSLTDGLLKTIEWYSTYYYVGNQYKELSV